MYELALFAGAGGGILGGKLLGWRTVCAVEYDAYARAVSPLLSRRTMEDWLQCRRCPPDWTHAYILAAVSRAAQRKLRRSANTKTTDAEEQT